MKHLRELLIVVCLCCSAFVSISAESFIYIQGDVNHDNAVNASDVTACITAILNGEQSLASYDINDDGNVNASDITELINIILGVEQPLRKEIVPVDSYVIFGTSKTAVDEEKGTITWDKPFDLRDIRHFESFDDMKGSIFAVRRLGQFKESYRRLIDIFKEHQPNANLFMFGVGPYNTNSYCSAWAYNEAIQEICEEYGGHYIHMIDTLQNYDESAILTGNYETVHLTANGLADYVIPYTQFNDHRRAIRVKVNGIDVTYKDVYIARTEGWHIIQNPEKLKNLKTIAKDWDGGICCKILS